MKGLVQSFSAATVFALGLNPGVNGLSPEAEHAGNHQSGTAVVVEGSPGVTRTDSRLLMRRQEGDDALDVNDTVSCRRHLRQ